MATQHPPSGIEHALLGLLLEGPAHAYELHRRVSRPDALGCVWRLKQSHLYALLTTLEEAGYLTATLQPQGGRPPRKLLELTDSGRDAFSRWLESPVHHGRDVRLEFLAKLAFLTHTDPSTFRRVVRLQREASAQWLAQQRAEAAQLAAGPALPWLVARFRVSQLEAIDHWLTDILPAEVTV